MKILFQILLCGLVSHTAIAQTCTSNPTTISSNINFGSITWTASGGATVLQCNNMADGVSTFTGNVVVDLANNKTITLTNNVTITGSFLISGGSGSVLSVNGGFKLSVSGNLGDSDNNGVEYEVATATDKIQVAGTLFGKNNNAFTGSGSISGGTLDVKNGSTCGSPCPVSGGFSNCDSGDGFCSSNLVLPIELLSFEAISKTEAVVLIWSTASQLNFDYFVVQHSVDGFEWADLTQIKGAGTTNQKLDYSFAHTSPVAGKNYYRLKSVDFDKTFEYSFIVAAEIALANDFTIYPNPTNSAEDVRYKLNFMPQESDQLIVYDITGAEIVSQKVTSLGDILELPATLKAGTYLVKYAKGTQLLTKQLVIK